MIHTHYTNIKSISYASIHIKSQHFLTFSAIQREKGNVKAMIMMDMIMRQVPHNPNAPSSDFSSPAMLWSAKIRCGHMKQGIEIEWEQRIL